MKSPYIIGAILSAALLSASIASAQTLGSAGPQPVQYTVAPEEPGPNAPVDITVAGVGDFLGNSQITWQENGKTALSGIGAREFSFTTGPLGNATVITVTIVSNTYGTITKQFQFNPSRIDLVWQADTSVPPFYEGLALVSPGSRVRVAAFPEVLIGGAPANAASLSFQWSLDGQKQPSQSGLGANVFTFDTNDTHQSADVSVEVMSGEAAVGAGEAVIQFVQPQIVFYAHDPLRGILYNDAVGSPFIMQSAEETLRAEPYFFSPNGITYDWQLNGQSATGPTTAQGELTLRQAGTGGGAANLSVSIQNSNPAQLLQAAQAALSITFGSGNSSSGGISLFGL